MTTELTIRAGQTPVWLCFEPWATEYTVGPGMTVVVRFNNRSPVEMTHHVQGITFMSLSRHPDIWDADGTPLEIFSDVMPEVPDVSIAAIRNIMAAVPPVPGGRQQAN